MNDFRFAIRQLLKNPGFTAVAVLTLALGIGGSTAVFSIINAVILRPLPYPEPERLALLWTEPADQSARKQRSAYGNYADWKEQCSAFEDLVIYDGFSCLLTGPEQSDKVSAARVSANFFSVLGVSPALGRGFTADEATQRAQVIVVSHRLWQNRFAADMNVIGRTLEIDGQKAEVVGVMPASFGFPSDNIDLWQLQGPQPNTPRGIGGWFVLGRLKSGQTLERAQSELQGVAAGLAQKFPRNRGMTARVVSLSEEIAGPNLRLALWILFGAVAAVLLIGCANLANLLLVRGVARQRELATRLALGASPLRLARQLVVECLPIGLLGGIGGVALAVLLVRVVRTLSGMGIPRIADIALDIPVLCFALALTALATLLFAIIPGLQARRLDVNESLKEGARGTGGSRQASLRHALVIGEVALAFTLLFGAGLLLRSFQSVQAVDKGFEPQRVLCVPLRLPQMRSNEQAVVFYSELSRRLESLPVVEAVGMIEDVFGGANVGAGITIDRDASPDRAQLTQVRRDAITPSWFQAVGATLLRGRPFDGSDRQGSLPVAIVNETMARRFWPDDEAVGKRFKLGPAASPAPWLTIVGVVRDMRRERLERSPMPQVLFPITQNPPRHVELLVKTASNPLALAETVRQEIRALDKGVAVYGISTLEKRISASLFERKFQTSLLSAFSLVALLLAGIGTYGVIHFSTRQRTREIGIRMVLGAQKLDVLSMIVGHGLKLVLVGVALGIALALALTRVMQRLLFEVKANDPLTFAVVSLLLIAIALLACWLPARRATKVHPMEALRYE